MVNGEFYSEGLLAIESALWNMIQFSNIKGPYQINNNQIFLGTGAPRILQSYYPKEPNTFRRPIQSVINGRLQSISAKVFGGDFFTDIVLLSGESSRFGASINLKNARLEQCGEVTESERLLGKFHISLNILGMGGDMNSLSGKGDLQLEEADVYHLQWFPCSKF